MCALTPRSRLRGTQSVRVPEERRVPEVDRAVNRQRKSVGIGRQYDEKHNDVAHNDDQVKIIDYRRD